ncbi:MAG: hypothetical protein AAFV33_09415 [Chloroflexota bacterium]
MSDFDSLRDFDDDFDDGFDPDDNAGVVLDDGGGASRSGFLGMSPVETLIIALFVVLNLVALAMIILIATERIAFGA